MACAMRWIRANGNKAVHRAHRVRHRERREKQETLAHSQCARVSCFKEAALSSVLSVSSLRSLRTRLFGRGVIGGYGIPVDRVPPGAQVVWATVLVIQVVGMFPNINT